MTVGYVDEFMFVDEEVHDVVDGQVKLEGFGAFLIL